MATVPHIATGINATVSAANLMSSTSIPIKSFADIVGDSNLGSQSCNTDVLCDALRVMEYSLGWRKGSSKGASHIGRWGILGDPYNGQYRTEVGPGRYKWYQSGPHRVRCVDEDVDSLGGNDVTPCELTGFGSHENSEVKRAWARAIPGWVTPWEAGRELPETKL
ncbi:hypothetical protein LguiA_029472 [Lonicera macranthoides]